jgi:hypothetical protein
MVRVIGPGQIDADWFGLARRRFSLGLIPGTGVLVLVLAC